MGRRRGAGCTQVLRHSRGWSPATRSACRTGRRYVAMYLIYRTPDVLYTGFVERAVPVRSGVGSCDGPGSLSVLLLTFDLMTFAATLFHVGASSIQQHFVGLAWGMRLDFCSFCASMTTGMISFHKCVPPCRCCTPQGSRPWSNPPSCYSCC